MSSEKDPDDHQQLWDRWRKKCLQRSVRAVVREKGENLERVVSHEGEKEDSTVSSDTCWKKKVMKDKGYKLSIEITIGDHWWSS